jgi:integrase/recombinase XerD
MLQCVLMGVRPNHFRQVLAQVRENRPKRHTVASRIKPALAEVTPLLNSLLTAKLQRLAVATALAIYAGLRRSEIAGLKASDVSPCGGHFHIVGKGQKRRVVPILPQLTPWLNLAMASWPTATYLVGFPSKSALDSECSRANKLNFSFQFHGLRRRFGTTLSQKNVPIDHIRLVLGHSSLVTTQLYIESDDEAVLQCFKGNKPIIF